MQRVSFAPSELVASSRETDSSVSHSDVRQKTFNKLGLNFKRNKVQDQTEVIDSLADGFRYADCKDSYWNPEKFSLLYGTPLWEQSSQAQRIVLNQLYWVAYYSQIISAEIATIYFNQTSAAGLYGVEDFRLVCDTLDLESMQERAHINAFKKIGEATEFALFGERMFTYPMRGPFVDTMIFHNTNRVKSFWRSIQLKAFSLLSSGHAFIGCQYFLVRGLRTLNGKLVQHQLGKFCQTFEEKDAAPNPAKVSFSHFLDESFHFNSSTIIGHDVLRCLPKPTAFERMVMNKTIRGCQRDHSTFSTAINGLFWFDPAMFPVVYKILRSPTFNLNHSETLEIMKRCFTEESEGCANSFHSKELAMSSYKAYLEDLDYVTPDNRNLTLMAKTNVTSHLQTNRRYFDAFKRQMSVQ